MTPDQFIGKWSANTRSEAAASKEHFLDLCALLGVPSPNTDSTGATYAFEKGTKKAGGINCRLSRGDATEHRQHCVRGRRESLQHRAHPK